MQYLHFILASSYTLLSSMNIVPIIIIVTLVYSNKHWFTSLRVSNNRDCLVTQQAPTGDLGTLIRVIVKPSVLG